MAYPGAVVRNAGDGGWQLMFCPIHIEGRVGSEPIHSAARAGLEAPPRAQASQGKGGLSTLVGDGPSAL